MRLVIAFSSIVLLQIAACQQGKNDTADQRGSAQAVQEENSEPLEEVKSEEARDLKVEEDSESALRAHIGDIEALKEAAGTAGFTDLSNHANSLLTHYEFEVVPFIQDQDFRQAAFAWDRGELYVSRMETTYSDLTDKGPVGDAWLSFQTSRELLVDLKEEWLTY